MPETLKTPSSILRETRETKGLTLEIVHEATKIPLDALKSIEQGYYVRTLSPFYQRGFIKIYAEFLGLDAQEVLKSYNVERPAPAAVPLHVVQKAPPASQPAPKALPPSKAANVPPEPPRPSPLAEFVNQAVTAVASPRHRKSLLRLLFVVGAIFVLMKVWGGIAQYAKTRPKPAQKTVVEKPKADEKSSLVREKSKDVAAAPAAKSAPHEPAKKATESADEVETIVPAAKPQGAANQKVELVVRAIHDSFVQVKADGRTVFSMIMQKGTMESWSGRDQIELSGKNINELELEVNGKHIGSLGASGRRAGKIVITKEGLTVKK